MGNEDEKFRNKIKNKHGNAATIPLVGSVVRLTHASVGTTQTVSALAATIVTFPYAIKVRKRVKRSWHHIEDGRRNITARAIETMPFARIVMKTNRQASSSK